MRLSLARRLSILISLAAALGLAPSVACAVLTNGVDVSTHQSTVNWTSMKNAGIEFAFAKATEGVDFIDTRFTANMSGAAAAGVYIGPYHFARPDSHSDDPNDAKSEANDFVDAIAPYYATPGKYLRPVLDMEEFDVPNPTPSLKAYISKWTRDFTSVVESRLGVKPILYTSSSFINTYFEKNVAVYGAADISTYPLWVANYNSAPPTLLSNSQTGFFNHWDFWQYTASGNIGGESPVDRDVYQGTLDDLLDRFLVQPTGDFNADGDVDGGDFLTWQRNMGKTGATVSFAGGDANFNATVNSADLTVWRGGFGAGGASTPASDQVPEPAAAVLAASTLAAAAAWRRWSARSR